MSHQTILNSKCGNYRTAITRLWDYNKPSVLFVALHPSQREDQQLAYKCEELAASWGYGKLTLTYLFLGIAKDPRELMAMKDPMGIKANILAASKAAQLTIFCWGSTNKKYKRIDEEVAKLAAQLPHARCLGKAEDGSPNTVYVDGAGQMVPELYTKKIDSDAAAADVVKEEEEEEVKETITERAIDDDKFD